MQHGGEYVSPDSPILGGYLFIIKEIIVKVAYIYFYFV